MAGPEAIEVGPLLREGMAVGLQRWWIFVLGGVAVAVGCLGWMTLLGRCLISPACASTDMFEFIVTRIDWIPWLANRLVGWPIMAFALYHVLVTERGNSAHTETGRPPRSRRIVHYAWCFAYFVAISGTAELIWMAPVPRVLPPDLAWLALCIECAVASGIWAYVDARFAIHLAAMILRRKDESHVWNWATIADGRRRVISLFFAIEAFLFVADHFVFSRTYAVIDYWALGRWVSSITLLPRDFLTFRLPEYVEYMIYISISNMVCTGAFVAIHRRLSGSSLHGTAAVFD